MAETIGKQLKNAREKRNLTTSDVSKATRILARHIEAIESDDFDSLPSPVQARAFLRIYADYLGLSLDNLIAHQREDQIEEDFLILPDHIPGEPAYIDSNSQFEQENTSQGKEKASTIEFALLIAKIKQYINHVFSFILSKFEKGNIKRTDFENNGSDNKHSITDENIGEGNNENRDVEQEEHIPKPDFAKKEEEIKESQVIFSSVGESLRARRETLSLTLDEIERHTHVRKRYLVALENGWFDELPSSVQGRGMLNNYAHYLDLDVDAILLKFAEGLQARRLEKQPKPELEEQHTPRNFLKKFSLPPSLKRFFTMDMIVGVGLIIILVFLAILGTSKIISQGSVSTPFPTAPSISDILQTPQGTTPNPFVSTGTNSNISNSGILATDFVVTNQAPVQGAVQVTALIVENAWMRVTVDGKIVFEGRVSPGIQYPFGGNNQIEILTGSGSAIRIIYNQSDLGLMGSFGQVVDRIYTPLSILNPTPTITPTVTITTTPTVTPIPSMTPTPTKTPRFTPTP